MARGRVWKSFLKSLLSETTRITNSNSLNFEAEIFLQKIHTQLQIHKTIQIFNPSPEFQKLEYTFYE